MAQQTKPYRLIVFEENESGTGKIAGILRHGRNLAIVGRINIEMTLPILIDEPEQFISDDFDADLVLDFLKHQDLSEHLAVVCRRKHIPVIASGKKHEGAITPFT